MTSCFIVTQIFNISLLIISASNSESTDIRKTSSETWLSTSVVLSSLPSDHNARQNSESPREQLALRGNHGPKFRQQKLKGLEINSIKTKEVGGEGKRDCPAK